MDNEKTDEELPRLPENRRDRKTSSSKETSTSSEIRNSHGVPKSTTQWAIAVYLCADLFSRLVGFNRNFDEMAKKAISTDIATIQGKFDVIENRLEQLNKDVARCEMNQKNLESQVDQNKAQLKTNQDANWWEVQEEIPSELRKILKKKKL